MSNITQFKVEKGEKSCSIIAFLLSSTLEPQKALTILTASFSL